MKALLKRLSKFAMSAMGAAALPTCFDHLPDQLMQRLDQLRVPPSNFDDNMARVSFSTSAGSNEATCHHNRWFRTTRQTIPVGVLPSVFSS